MENAASKGVLLRVSTDFVFQLVFNRVLTPAYLSVPNTVQYHAYSEAYQWSHSMDESLRRIESCILSASLYLEAGHEIPQGSVLNSACFKKSLILRDASYQFALISVSL